MTKRGFKKLAAEQMDRARTCRAILDGIHVDELERRTRVVYEWFAQERRIAWQAAKRDARKAPR